MTSSILSSTQHFDSDQHYWENLKQAIAASSGFQRWQEEQAVDQQEPEDLDKRVCSYLRETLETLAY